MQLTVESPRYWQITVKCVTTKTNECVQFSEQVLFRLIGDQLVQALFETLSPIEA